MASRRTKSFHQPFEGLDRLIEHRQIALAEKKPHRSSAAQPEPLPAHQEDDLFAREMADVVPLARHRNRQPPSTPIPPAPPGKTGRTDGALRALYLLVETGRGFKIAHTPEYMEARAPGVQPEICRRLHGGRYAIQDHIDLHGMTVSEAEAALHAFIKRTIAHGMRAVLVVHGRGLSSPHDPVLKKWFYRWITTGPWKKFVIALTSARSCDGGAGATYVLLRQRALKKKLRKAAFKGQEGGA